MVVDIDVHHGDGVESAFYHSSRVLTISFHLYEKGFFPGTGAPSHQGAGKGLGYNINEIFSIGTNGDEYVKRFRERIEKESFSFQPDAIVLVCGADALIGDPRGGLKLRPDDIVECVKILKNKEKPLLILGGGGYSFPQVSRCWTMVTALLCEVSLSEFIPEHRYIEHYGPSWTL